MRENSRPLRAVGLVPRLAVALAAASGMVWMSFAPAGAATSPATSPATAPAAAAPRAAVQLAPAAAEAGATTPFTTYEAEAGTLGGGAGAVSLTAAPTTQYSSAALEASGHAYVHLAGTGQSVQWTNTTGAPISFINVRASLPDSAAGGGITGTLDLYVNGTFRQALNLNSKQTWVYEGNDNYNTSDNQNPADGSPRVFFDEAHTFVTGAAIAPGSTFSLQKDAANSASFYDVDVVDVENPPAPLAQPANSISITSCGAVADDIPTNGSADAQSVDSGPAIQNCINQAQSQGKVLWIPQGTFYVKGTNGLQAQGITIAGAGQWYSTVYRDVPVPNNTPLAALFSVTSCTVQNFHIDANAVSRSTIGGDGGAMDTTGTDWLANGIWTQHTMSGFWASGTGGKVENSRLTSIWADGINLNNVSLNASSGNNLTATNNFVRGTGDDAMAINSVSYNTNGSSTTYYNPMTDITMTDNTTVAPWGGKGIGIYGGSGHLVSDNYISDTARYIGLGAGRFGVNGSDLLSATVSGNVVLRSGGNAYSQGQPALHIGNGGDGQNTGVVDHVTVTNNTVANSLYDAVGFSTSTNTLLQNNTITDPGRNGVVISPSFYPAPTGSATITGNTVTGLKAGATAFANNSSGFTATLSNNNWQGGTPVEAPFGGTAAPLPGTVQAENYDTGGQGLAYNVTSVNGSGNNYRADGVNLESTSDTGGGYDLGWTTGGQWFRYTVNAATAGTYTVSLRVAAPSAVSGALHLSNASGTNLSGAVTIPATGGFQTWATVTAQVALPAGQQVLTVNQDQGGWNLNSLAFATGGGSPATATLAASPASLTFAARTVNTTSPAQTVTLANTGTAAASVSSIAAAGDFAQTNTCGTSIAAGASCTISVTFTPTASGTRTGGVTVTGSASDSPTTVALSGTGAGATSTNLAAGKATGESSHTQTYGSAAVTDNNQSTYWESANSAFPQWVQVDLGSAQSASRVVLRLPAGWGVRTQTLSLLASTDGSTFSTVQASATYTFDPNGNNTVTITFPATTQRYFRVNITANSGWPAGQLSEFQVWNS
ncbi:discoidin domain-containing protein [Actinacidiphila sp. ITFR-21]|uniref:discoidin domain-containing protein n=1 Tax=Actinacidiphila sp. ITFR-21 TaxID=3075199 RepID=UPI002889E02F|nr:discoidin domain-containing protein [Streptomyces sp. ITFR-21]WNI16124.1 discoidin domain-containing protein [Streptomyces sp. ITFR-21]